MTGTYGSVTIGADGSWSYTLDNADPRHQRAGAGRHGAPTCSAYTVTDAVGATSTANLTITITGTNDAPVASGDSNAADAVVESGVNPGNTPFAGDPAATGNVLTNDTDVDTGDTMTVTAVGGPAVNVGQPWPAPTARSRSLADGSWTYTLDNADPDTNALAQGQTVTDVFSYTVTDAVRRHLDREPDHHHHRHQRRAGGGGDSNAGDAVVETGVNPGNTPLPGDPAAAGNVLTNDTDVDTGDTHDRDRGQRLGANVGAAVAGTYGSLTIGADGS